MTSNPQNQTALESGLKLDFPAHARELALHWGRRWMLGISAAAILWWPTDPFVFADSPESQEVFAWIRGLGLLLHLGMYALLTWVPWVRQRALLVLSVYGSVAIMLPAFALSYLGGPDDGWFGYLYLALIPGAFVQPAPRCGSASPRTPSPRSPPRSPTSGSTPSISPTNRPPPRSRISSSRPPSRSVWAWSSMVSSTAPTSRR
ncbi:MAG TPA: hypothetical protein PK095_04555 [Myxococcota bacterium]|nr:hypothetical protein [Myxococcota bacterium]